MDRDRIATGPGNPSLDAYFEGVRGCDRAILGRAITLIESNLPRDYELAQQLLTLLMPYSGQAMRLGITGVPGVGKSTFIETLGSQLTSSGRRVAVLAIDPSSSVTGGSILGDKTRMTRLSVDNNAFVRPSPSGGMLGGVARKTRETVIVCEAAGFDVVIVETVGVGQSETVVADMTDLFLALMLPGAGDELQGIKRGLFELVDMVVINKADGPNENAAEQAAREYRAAMRFMHTADGESTPEVLTCSALEGTGVDDVWQIVVDRHAELTRSGRLETKRSEQMLRWMRSIVDEELRRALHADPRVKRMWHDVEADVVAGRIPAGAGAARIIEAFEQR